MVLLDCLQLTVWSFTHSYFALLLSFVLFISQMLDLVSGGCLDFVFIAFSQAHFIFIFPIFWF